MENLFFFFMVMSFTVFSFSGIVESRSRARMYLDSQCKSTRYLDICVQTLLPYVSRRGIPSAQLQAQISLASCLSKARFTESYMSMVAKKLNATSNSRDYQTMKECLHQISDGVKQIRHSFKELQQMGKDGVDKFLWHESNVQSWVSAALTDSTSCIDEITGGGISNSEKAMIQARIVNMKQLASNSLALFNRFTMRFRASHGIKIP